MHFDIFMPIEVANLEKIYRVLESYSGFFCVCNNKIMGDFVQEQCPQTSP